ncbi:MAG TPA: FAD:protein FMN transferase [Gemmatales bacterium]|nr:FAD:protein FMN transferase [Gemmatales bacterium]
MPMLNLLFFLGMVLSNVSFMTVQKPSAVLPTGSKPPDEKWHRYEYSEPHMGTIFRIQLYAPAQEQADQAAQAAFARVQALNAIFSDYQEDSELMQLCKRAGSGPVAVSPELYDILLQSWAWSARSEGAFDVTLGPRVQRWRKARRTRQLPAQAAIEEARSRLGYQALELLPGSRVTLKKPRMRLDLGGIAKGYTADEVQKVLKQHGITSACVAAGGDVCVSARPPGKPGWVVSIAPLTHDEEVATQLLLEHQAVSTSGDLEQYVEIAGVRYSHLVNPKTGFGLTQRMSATVVARQATDSDAAATALCILDREKGLALIEKQPGLAAMLVVQQGTEKRAYESSRWKRLVLK